MRQVGRTDTKIAGVEERLTSLIDKAITQFRCFESEAQEEISMADVLNGVISFIQRYGESSVRRLMIRPIIRRRFGRQCVREALAFLLRDEITEASGDIEDLKTVVRIHKRFRQEQTNEEAEQEN